MEHWLDKLTDLTAVKGDEFILTKALTKLTHQALADGCRTIAHQQTDRDISQCVDMIAGANGEQANALQDVNATVTRIDQTPPWLRRERLPAAS